MVILDTDIFILEFRFQRDHRYFTNRQFLSAIKATGGGITSYSVRAFGFERGGPVVWQLRLFELGGQNATYQD